jgi:hypothetical protein
MYQTDNNNNNKMGSKNVYKLLHHCRLNAVHINDKSQNKKFFSNCNQELDGPEEEEENVFFFFFFLMWHTNSISNVHIFGLLLGVSEQGREILCVNLHLFINLRVSL